jgi:hypothetical protein
MPAVLESAQRPETEVMQFEERLKGKHANFNPVAAC